MSDDSTRVPTNLRMLMIVEILAEAGQALTPSEINKTPTDVPTFMTHPP